MILIIGGAYQGKMEYVKENFEPKDVFLCNPQKAELDFTKDAIDRLEDFVLACVNEGIEAKDYLMNHRAMLEDKIIICTDISQGIVPMEARMRALREMTGRAMVYLAKEAETVIRVFCGLGQKIK